jgi:glycosyltransferase involved in cell wall biosynthesis
VVHGRHLLIADAPAAFAEAVLRLLRERSLRETLAAGARHHVQRYDWRTIGDALDDVVTSAARGRGRRTAMSTLTYAADSH